MHPCIYREFIVTTEPSLAREKDTAVLVTLHHRASGVRHAFPLVGCLKHYDQLIEQKVLQLFPDSETAQVLRYLKGLPLYRLRSGWLGDFASGFKVALLGACDSEGATFWWNQLELLPKPIGFMLLKRSAEKLTLLKGAQPLHVFATAVKTAWSEVLLEASKLDGWRDVRMTELAIAGWPVQQLEPLSNDMLRKISDQARLAHMALPFLTDLDWFGMLSFAAEEVPASMPEAMAAYA